MTTLTSLKNSPPQEAAHTTQGPKPAAPRPLVLIVEDHEDTRFMLRVLLERRGVGVAEVDNGAAAISAVKRARPQLILMDGSLPFLDGFAATSRLRQLEAMRGVPIIFLSGHAEPDYLRRAYDAGCDGYLVKPIDMKQLDRVLDLHLFQRPTGQL